MRTIILVFAVLYAIALASTAHRIDTNVETLLQRDAETSVCTPRAEKPEPDHGVTIHRLQ